MFRQRPAPQAAPRHPDPAVATSHYEEEKARDLAMLAHTGGQRTRIALAVGFLLAGAVQLGIVEGSIGVTAIVVAIGLASNLLFVYFATRHYGRYWVHASAIFDTILVSVAVFLGGKPLLVCLYFLVIVPYALDRGVEVGKATTLASVTGFFTAAWGYNQLHPDLPMPWSEVLLAGLMLALAAQQAIRIPARLESRMRRARAQMALVERGDLTARMQARHDDSLGFLERSLNRMLDELLSVVETVQRETEALLAVATQVEGEVGALRARAHDVATGAHTVSQEAARQHAAVREGTQASQKARRAADASRTLARETAASAESMHGDSTAGREAIDEAARMLLRAGASVEDAAERVRRLGPASEQVGEFVARVSRIARQTNLLALNAAIEAARAGEEGAGFAVVADEIRALAVESASASKVIAATVQRVRDDMTEAVQAMDSTSMELSGARSIAMGATHAMLRLVDGVGAMADGSAAVARLAEEQAQLSNGVARSLETMDASSQRVSAEARRAAESTASQQASIEALAHSAQELSASLQRLRLVARSDWYQLLRTGTHAAMRTSASGNHAVMVTGSHEVLGAAGNGAGASRPATRPATRTGAHRIPVHTPVQSPVRTPVMNPAVR